MAPNYQLLTKIQRAIKLTQPASTYFALRSLYWCNAGLPSRDGEVSILLTRREQGRRAHFHGVQHCNNPWSCPVCTARVLELKAAEITQIIEAKKIEGLYAKMLTLTLPHHRLLTAAAALRAIQVVKRRFNRNLRYVLRKQIPSWKGTITSMECKYSSAYGWHWHYHVLYFMNAEDCVKFDGLYDELLRHWRNAAQTELNLSIIEDNVTVRASKAVGTKAIFISPGIIKNGSYIAKEVVKETNRSKISRSPFELAASKDPRDLELFFEFALAARGKQRIQIGQNMRQYIDRDALLKNLSGNGVISTTLVCSWSSDDWSEIVAAEFDNKQPAEPSVRKKLLTAAELDGASGVCDVCNELDLPFPRIHSKTVYRDVMTEQLLRDLMPAAATVLNVHTEGGLTLLSRPVVADMIYTPEEWRQRQRNIAENRALQNALFGDLEHEQTITVGVLDVVK